MTVETLSEIPDPDWDKLRAAVRDYMEFRHSADYFADGVDDYKQWIFEAAVLAVYGSEVFDYLRKLNE